MTSKKSGEDFERKFFQLLDKNRYENRSAEEIAAERFFDADEGEFDELIKEIRASRKEWEIHAGKNTLNKHDCAFIDPTFGAPLTAAKLVGQDLKVFHNEGAE